MSSKVQLPRGPCWYYFSSEAISHELEWLCLSTIRAKKIYSSKVMEFATNKQSQNKT
jgi:hypothetical protein